MSSRLNPHASVFIPTTSHTPSPTPPAFSSGFIPPAGPPPPFTPFSYHLLPPPPLPPLPPLPPPPPPPPPPQPFISVPRRPRVLPPPVAAEAELIPIFVNRPSNVRIATRGPGARVSTTGGGGGRGGVFGGGRRYHQTEYRVRERDRGRSTHDFTGENNGGTNWKYVKKHGMRYLREDEYKTTVMIKNIPYEFTRQMLIEFMDKHCMSENQQNGDTRRSGNVPISAYDFLYLPIDFKTRKNKGYAFVNFTHPSAVWKFFNAFNSSRWESTDSPKIRRIICARIQGKRALVQHFEKTYFDCETDEFLPVCFKPARDGCGDWVEMEVTSVGRYKGNQPQPQPQPPY